MQESLFDTGETVPRTRMARRPLAPREWACIQAGLEEFNAQAKCNLSALRGDGRLSDAGTRIGMRARQWPALSPNDFRRIVQQGFQHPWWSGRPSVGVIFNEGCFEHLLHPPAPTEDEFDAYLRSLDAEPPLESTAEEIA